mgnify:CR=1 FL=1
MGRGSRREMAKRMETESMKLTKAIIKKLIKEELANLKETNIKVSLQEDEIDLNAIGDNAQKVADELMKDDGQINDVIAKAAEAMVGDAKDQIPMAMQLIKQAMAEA